MNGSKVAIILADGRNLAAAVTEALKVEPGPPIATVVVRAPKVDVAAETRAQLEPRHKDWKQRDKPRRRR